MREKAIKIKRKRCASDWFLDIFKVVFLVLITVICVYPFWNIFVVSINDATDALRGGLYFLPRKLSLASYKDILGCHIFAWHSDHCTSYCNWYTAGGPCHDSTCLCAFQKRAAVPETAEPVLYLHHVFWRRNGSVLYGIKEPWNAE